jgi:ribonucleoside-diphosphate reductase alpha chain
LASSGDERLAPAARPAAEPELPVVEANGHANGQTNGRANGGGGTAPSSAGSGAVTLDLGGTKVSFQAQADAPSCAECGSIMIRNGSCYKCLNCGSTSGCS